MRTCAIIRTASLKHRGMEKALAEKGFCVLNDVFTSNEIKDLKTKFHRCEAAVYEACKTNQPHPYEYIQQSDKEYVINMQAYCDSSIIETAKGRYDVTTQMVKDEFKAVPEKPAIANLMKLCLQRRYLCDVGILMTCPQGEDGPWHRDTYNLNGSADPDGSYDDSVVMKLKPFYYTCLVALDDITEDNGRTELIQGSHRLTYMEAKDKGRIKQDVKAGSVLVFDGRMLHRACVHLSAKLRQIIYFVFHRDWYVDV